MCLLLPLKSRSTRGASHHPAFIGNYLTISHTFLTLSTQWVSSSPSRKWRREVSPRFHLIAFRGRVLAIPTQLVSSPSREWRHGVSSRFHLIFLCLMWIKRIKRQGEFKLLLCNSSGGNLLLWQSRKTANGLNPYQSLLGL